MIAGEASCRAALPDFLHSSIRYGGRVPTIPKPKGLDSKYAQVFHLPDVAKLYDHRPAYPQPILDQLASLPGVDTGTILDIGCGTGELARRLAPVAEHVYGMDVSRPMLERARTLPGGNAANLEWIEGRIEEMPLLGHHALIAAGDSLHWMDWDIVLPRLGRILVDNGVLALVSRDWSLGVEEEGEILREFAVNRDYQPFDLVRELERRGYFEKIGEREAWAPWTPTVEEFIASRHSQSALPRELLGEARVAEFDRRIERLIERLVEAGGIKQTGNRLSLTVQAKSIWGKPVSVRW